MTRHIRTGQDGSLVLALLVVIVLGGVIVALFTTVRSSEWTARADRDFHQAVQVADAGIQQAFVNFREQPDPGVPPGCDPADETVYGPSTPTHGFCVGTVDAAGEGSFVWEYQHLGGERWRIISEGTYRGAARTIEADIGPQQLFDVAILAKQWLTYNGGGGGPPDPFMVGSFGTITANGGAVNHLAGVVLYGAGPHVWPGAISNVSNGGNPPLPNIAAAAFEEGGPCEDGPEAAVYPTDFPAPAVRGQVYCASRIDFGNGTWLQDLQASAAPGAEPIKVYVDAAGANALTMGGNGRVNFHGAAQPVLHRASDLQIYVAGGAVTISGSSGLAASIWAPDSDCTSNGGTNFHGAMVCNTVTLNGNFQFAADVDGITDGEFSVNNWQERVATGGVG